MMTPDAIVPMVLIVVDALNGRHGEAVRLAAIEAMQKATAESHRETPVRH